MKIISGENRAQAGLAHQQPPPPLLIMLEDMLHNRIVSLEDPTTPLDIVLFHDERHTLKILRGVAIIALFDGANVVCIGDHDSDLFGAQNFVAVKDCHQALKELLPLRLVASAQHRWDKLASEKADRVPPHETQPTLPRAATETVAVFVKPDHAPNALLQQLLPRLAGLVLVKGCEGA